MITNHTNPQLRTALGVIARDPRNIGANIQAGVYFAQDKNWDRACEHLKIALSGDKKNPLILQKLSEVLIDAHQPIAARKYARKLIELKKRDAGAMHVMARVFDELGDPKKAMHWIEMALHLEPENQRMLGEKAKYLSSMGEIEKSLAVHEKILQLNPLAPNSWWPIAQLQKFEGEEAHRVLKQIRAAIAKTENIDELRSLHYAAGKIEQDDKNYETAFAHFEKANVLHECDISADRIVAANINIRETYSRELFENSREKGDGGAQPIFILGQTRSGTTLTESLCGAHSKISAGGELANFNDFNKRLEIYSLIEKAHHDRIHGLTSMKIQEMAREFKSKTRHLSVGGTNLIDKLPHNFLNIGLIALIFPRARIIHCRRHPMDNCLSIFSNPMVDYHKEYKSRLDVLAQYYHNYHQIMEYWKEICPIPIHDVYYEDLVSNTQYVARRMIEYLGLKWEDGVMDRSGSQKMVKTLSVWQVRQPVFQTSKDKWRNYETQLEPLRQAIGTYVDDYEKELIALDQTQDPVVA